MSEAYVKALCDELASWQELDALVHVQRKAIINRDSGQVWECQERLRERLREVMLACQESTRLRTELSGAEAETEQKVKALRRQVRDGIGLNNDLLRDICSYLEMVREVAFPQTVPLTYGRSRQATKGRSITGTKVA